MSSIGPNVRKKNRNKNKFEDKNKNVKIYTK